MSGFSDAFKHVLATLAPTIGTALLGPFGGMAGAFLASKLGTAPGDTKALEAAVTSGDPDLLLKIKQADNEFQEKLKELGIEEDKLYFDDRSNARAREAAVRDHTPASLAYFVTIGFFGTLAFMLWHGKPTMGGDALLVMLGSLGTAWAGVISYYFGSSMGSANKDKALADIAKQP